MSIGINLKNLVSAHEGGHMLKMYEDSKGILTVGVGHNIEERGISQAVSELMFEEDLQITVDECSQRFSWFNDMGEVRQAAIVDMVFNMGMPTFRTFTNTISYLSNRSYLSASMEMLRGTGPEGKSKWYNDVGSRALTISKMVETGEWQ